MFLPPSPYTNYALRLTAMRTKPRDVIHPGGFSLQPHDGPLNEPLNKPSGLIISIHFEELHRCSFDVGVLRNMTDVMYRKT